jgi:hypothetical protein
LTNESSRIKVKDGKLVNYILPLSQDIRSTHKSRFKLRNI